jgi:predicted N-acetyltransferase YhbS
MKIRTLERREVDDVWSIDRSELVERVYVREGDGLALREERHDVKGWPPGESEHYGAILVDCFDHGGTFYGAFDGPTLAGVAVLESRFIGRERDQLQLKFLHVSRSYRGTGVGRALFEKAVERARGLGARRLYVSATPSENTIGFYLGRGCRLAGEVDPELFALEPEDIHLELAIPPRVVT